MKKYLILTIVSLVSSIIYAQPTIISFSPTSGAVGTEITITGTNFSPFPSDNIVFLGAVRANVSQASSTSLTVTAPLGASNFPITVTTGNLTAYSNSPFIITFPGGGSDFSSLSFATKTDFTTAAWATGLADIDLDGDGKPDIVTSNYTPNLISVLKNNSTIGNLSYSVHTDYPSGLLASDAFSGDIDGDGKPDIAVVNWNSNSVSLYRNTSSIGNILFETRIDLSAGTAPQGVSIADLDGDGKPELITANVNSHNISVFRNTSSPGIISFALPVSFATGFNAQSIIVRDLDLDGKPDVGVVANGANTVAVFRNLCTPGVIAFQPKINLATGNGPNWIDVGDLDGDGLPDLAVANNQTTTVSVFRNTSSVGVISFSGKIDYFVGDFPQHVAIGDLNGDGKPDLAVTDNAGGLSLVSIYKNNCSPGIISFAAKTDYLTGSAPNALVIGDIDGDGRPDITTANQSGSISVLRSLMGTIPLTLTNVSAKIVENHSLITWQTLTEQNTSHFIIQHSVDGIKYSDIGRVDAAGNSNTILRYQFIHNNPQTGINLYRLKMFDIDQSFSFSPLVRVDLISENSGLCLSSNPAKHFLIVNHPKSEQSEIILIDITGRNIKKINVGKFSSTTTIDLSGIISGTYNVVWRDRNSSMSTQLIIIQ